MRLSELSAAQEKYRDAIERLIIEMTDPETGEFLASDDNVEAVMTLNDLAQMTEADLDAKAETIALYVLDIDAEAKAIKEQEQKLAKRRKTLENKGNWLRSYLSSNLHGRKVSTPRMQITWRKSTVVEVEDEFVAWAMENGDQFLRYKAPEVDKTALKNAIKSGADVPFAGLVERESMNIK